jgi:hypothetical protein
MQYGTTTVTLKIKVDIDYEYQLRISEYRMFSKLEAVLSWPWSVINHYAHIANEEHSWTLIMNTTSVLEIFYAISTLVVSMLLALLDILLDPDIDHEYHLREGDITQIFLASFFLWQHCFLFLQLPQPSLLQKRMKRKYFTFAFCSIFGLLQYSQRFTGIIAYAFIILRIFEKSQPHLFAG